MKKDTHHLCYFTIYVFNNPELRTTLALNHNNPSHLNNKKEERKRGFSLAITSYEQRRTDARAHRVSHTVREKKKKRKRKEKEDSAPPSKFELSAFN